MKIHGKNALGMPKIKNYLYLQIFMEIIALKFH
mgnify:CR=1 FL=1